MTATISEIEVFEELAQEQDRPCEMKCIHGLLGYVGSADWAVVYRPKYPCGWVTSPRVELSCDSCWEYIQHPSYGLSCMHCGLPITVEEAVERVEKL